jgi:hypothetical protein
LISLFLDVVESSTDKRTQPAKPTNGDAEFDEDDDDDVVDLRAFNTADKVIYMDLFELPPQPKVVKNWVMQHSKSFAQRITIRNCGHKLRA